ncbi:MAG: hypothetical protein PHW04_10150 [Candidatus Wallbacteria bacterium]|nr:hypothetical protein [Candidatus Wallbacteria bacterium]
MKKTLTILLVLVSLVALEARQNYLDYNFKHNYSLFLNFNGYQPDDIMTAAGSSMRGTLVCGGFGWYPSKDCLLDLSYGTYSETKDSHKGEVNPLLIEATWFHNLADNWQFLYGIGTGSFNVHYQPVASGTIYSDSVWGFSTRLGFAYLVSESFNISLEGKYLTADVNDLIPSTAAVAPCGSRDISVSDWTYGIGLNFTWK